MKVLIVGGAGYIGSHMALMLGQQSAQVVGIEDLFVRPCRCGIVWQTGARQHRRHWIARSLVCRGEVRWRHALRVFYSSRRIGSASAKYYRNNVTHTLNLLDAMVRHRVENFIFSSTAAVFGQPEYVPIEKRTPSSRSILRPHKIDGRTGAARLRPRL